VFATTAQSSAAIRREVRAERARKLAGRLYTRNTDQPLEQVALRNWQRIAAHHFPGAVVADRSAFEAKPAADGSIFLDAGPDYARRQPVRLPGLTLRPRRGVGVSDGDMPYMGINISSEPRAYLDNLSRSRARDGVPRTLSRSEIERELVKLAELRGEQSLNELRDRARALAPVLGAETQMKELDALIGSILGTRGGPLETSAGRAGQGGSPFDTDRVELFARLQVELLRQPHPARAAQPGSWPVLSFFEAYFSNWIEGTEFEVAEAEEIVLSNQIPVGRFEDAHDVLGTFGLVDDPVKRRRVPLDADGLLEELRQFHAEMLGRRPSARPGSFKERPNRAGETTFVAPELVNGTLREGFRFLEPLPPGFARATFVMFLVSEVHPFVDGNGRIARALMNAELSAVDEQRILIPLPYRDDYLGGLWALSRNHNPKPLIRVLDFAQRYAAGIEWSDLRWAERMLAETNAFVPPDEVEETGRRLRLPTPG
jgi:hypothetical protein